jgi:predicted kinase
VIVSGAPGTGKSMLVGRLAPLLGLPLLAKDDFKESLMDALQDDSDRVGRAAIAMLHTAASALLDAGIGMILECAYHRGHSDDLERLCERARSVQVHCTAPPELLVERYAGRVRHPGHRDAEKVPLLRQRLEAGTYEIDVPMPRLVIDTRCTAPEDVVTWCRGALNGQP